VTPEGEEVMKPYTPVTDDSTLGVVEFVVKVYPAGRVSRALDALAVGDRVLAKGPRGRFRYARGMASHIGMVAGGTGITPCYQVAAAALADPDDTTKFSLVFANVTADDVLIKDRLDALARAHPTRFAAHYVLNDPPPAWAGSVGFVTPDIIKRQLPPPGEGVLVVRCGPPPMNKAVGAALDGLGYGREAQFEF
jgi:cytochrome-b5 reductase